MSVFRETCGANKHLLPSWRFVCSVLRKRGFVPIKFSLCLRLTRPGAYPAFAGQGNPIFFPASQLLFFHSKRRASHEETRPICVPAPSDRRRRSRPRAGDHRVPDGHRHRGRNPLPGATVTISSPALQGTRVAVRAQRQLQHPGPAPRRLHGRVRDSRNADQDPEGPPPARPDDSRRRSALALGRQGGRHRQREAETVLETTQIATNFTSEQIARLPVARTIIPTVLLAPGVSNTGVNNQVTISGAPVLRQRFLVNGVVVNENLRGQPHNLFIEDAIQETTILAGGVSAEYGRFTGGVVSTLTKSGGNKFSGSFRDSFTNPDWTEKTPWPDRSRPRRQHGPGLRGDPRRPDTARTTSGSSARGGWPSGPPAFHRVTNLPYTNGFDETRWEGKLTAQIASGHNFVASYLDITNDETNNAFGERPRLREPGPDPFAPQHPPRVQLQRRDHEEPARRGAVREEGVHLREQRRTLHRPHQRDAARGHERPPLPRPTFCGVCSFEERDNDS